MPILESRHFQRGSGVVLENSAIDTLCRHYPDPVGRLLTVGDANIFKSIEWPDYLERYELGKDHIPELIQMACDLTLHLSRSEGPEIWGPVHAWRALAQMKAEEAIRPLLEFMKIELDDDAVSQEFAMVFGMIGPAAIGPITAVLSDRTTAWLPASLASGGLSEIVKRHPECRDECVAILTRLLENADDMDPMTNGFTIASLLDVGAVEAIDTIRDAFRRDVIDISIAGDVEDVEIDLGLRGQRSTPRPHYLQLPGRVERADRMAFDDFGGDLLPPPRKAGRNDPCPCGSGRKFKKCCLH